MPAFRAAHMDIVLMHECWQKLATYKSLGCSLATSIMFGPDKDKQTNKQSIKQKKPTKQLHCYTTVLFVCLSQGHT